jgi:hypothetical protein
MFTRSDEIDLNEKLNLLLWGQHNQTFKLEKIMAQIDDLNAAVAALQDTAGKINTDVTAVIAELQALQATGTGPDLSGPIATLVSVNTALTSIDSTLEAAEPAPTGTTTTGTPATTGGPNASATPVVPFGTVPVAATADTTPATATPVDATTPTV